MRTMTTAANLNAMIQQHIDSLGTDEYVWHSPVYLHRADRSGCIWNVEVNCNDDATACGPSISQYIDEMRTTYWVSPKDATAARCEESWGLSTIWRALAK